MMRKKAFAIFFVFSLVSSFAQALTFAYPTKSALKKADHVASLATSAAFIATYIAGECEIEADWVDALFCLHAIALGANGIINGMAFKHERSLGTILKFLLPAGTLGGWMAFFKAPENSNLQGVGVLTAVFGVGVNGIKNIWDVYSLIKYSQSERTQHDA